MADDALAALRRGPDHVWLYGHRGARGIIPENTIPSIEHALDIGLRALEIDVLALADATPVVTHNFRFLPDLTRDVNGAWLTEPGPRVIDLDVAGVKRLDVGAMRPGSAYAARFPDQAIMHGLRVPTLDEVCARLAAQPDRPVWLMLEVKSDPAKRGDVPPLPAYVEAVLAVVERHGLAPTTMMQSFDWSVLSQCARQAPHVARSYLTERPNALSTGTLYRDSAWLDGLSFDPADTPDIIASLGGRAWAPFHADLTEADMTTARSLLVNPWTVNDRADMERVMDLGVDGIVTDYPGRAQQVLAARGLGFRG